MAPSTDMEIGKAGKYLRLARSDDIPELRRLAKEQSEKLRWVVEDTDHFSSPVVLTMVHERDGRIVGGFVIEAIAELCFLSDDAETTALVKEWSPEILALLASKSFRRVRSFVPRVQNLPETLGKHFEQCGFENHDKALSHFSLSLRATDGNTFHKE